MESWISGVMDGSVGSDEISLVISKLLEEALFSRIKAPDISEFITKSQDIEMRRAVRNFSLECVKVAKNVRTRESNGNYSIVLFDEIQNFAALSKKYPKSTLLKFHKASSPIFTLDLNSERDIDILFTGTTIQKTKNFSLCYEILDNILFERPQTSIALVGVEEGVDNLKKRWSEYNVEIYGRISKEDLGKLYNRSKNHLITSGRDCFPRTIPESISCGCFNLVLDILSDGVSIFRENPGIGRVIDTSGSITILEPNYSISLEPRGDSLHRQIIEAIETSHDAYFISTLGKNLLPIDRMVQMDKVWESVDLGNISFSP